MSNTYPIDKKKCEANSTLFEGFDPIDEAQKVIDSKAIAENVILLSVQSKTHSMYAYYWAHIWIMQIIRNFKIFICIFTWNYISDS